MSSNASPGNNENQKNTNTPGRAGQYGKQIIKKMFLVLNNIENYQYYSFTMV